MARLGRIVAAGFPHHVIQRGNRRQPIFFEPGDYASEFAATLERITGRRLQPQKPGRRPTARTDQLGATNAGKE